MASMRRPVRPVKWSIGMGIGDALGQTSKMFGQLGQMQLDAEALEAERQWRSGERLKGEAFTAGQNTLTRDLQSSEAVLDRTAREDAEQLRMDELERVRLANIDVDAGVVDTAAGRRAATGESTWGALSKDQQLEYANKTSMTTEAMIAVDPNQPWIVEIDNNGEVITASSPDPTYMKAADGTWIKATNVTNQKSAMEIEIRSASQYVLFDSGMQELERVLTEGGYDLRSGTAFYDQATGKVPGGNWLVTREGQAYQNAINMANEALFKSLSGAAGSDPEAMRFQRMLPAPGDSVATVRFKMEAMTRISNQMRSAGFNGLEQGEQAKQAWSFTKQLANAEMGKRQDIYYPTNARLAPDGTNPFVIDDFGGQNLSPTARSYLNNSNQSGQPTAGMTAAEAMEFYNLSGIR